jgi:Sulfotransferase family
MVPFFLVGSERSGTTLLGLMLSNHPELAFHREFDFCASRLPVGSGFPQMAEYHEWVSSQLMFIESQLEIDKNLDYIALMNSFLHQVKEQSGNKSNIGATVHLGFDRLPRVWPSAKYIHIIRDGRDVARSAVGMGWAGNVWAGATIWVEAEEAWKRLVKSLCTPDYIEIYFQDLVRNPIQQLTRICEFIGIRYNHEMIEYSKHSTYAPPDEKLLGQWKRNLTPYELQTVESRIAPLLVEHGFELSGHPLIKLSAIAQRRLTFHSWLLKIKFRIDHVGFGLFCIDFAARRIPLFNGLQNWTRKKIWAITITHFK